jgi:hypothetical protein
MQSGLTEYVLRKWRKQAVFHRYLDGDRRNHAAKNLRAVALKEALVHINDWVCDWDLELTDHEILLVNNSLWRCEIIRRL